MSLYSIAHILRDRFGWLWNFIEWINGVVFLLRYGNKLKGFTFTVVPEGYDMVPIRNLPTDKMVDFFAHQPKEAFSKQFDNMKTVAKMKEIVPEYKSNNSIYEELDK